VAVGDFQGTGALGLAVTNQYANSVSVLLGQGNGAFEGATISTVGAGPSDIAAGDFTGHGRSDLAVANHGVSILLAHSDGTFQAGASYSHFNADVQSVAVGDFNGDGKADLALNSGNILLGNGDGTFQSPGWYIPNPARWVAVAVGDFNGDGHLDLAFTNPYTAGGLDVVLSNGDGTFRPTVSYTIEGYPDSVAVADVNGDGIPDLITANSGDNSVSVLLGNGDGTFQRAVDYPTATGDGPQTVAVGDFNGDGQPDLAVTGGSGVSVLLGNGNGSFQAPVAYATGDSPRGLAVGDLNGDGIPDVVVGNYEYPDPNADTVSVLLGQGDGTFLPPMSYPAGIQVSAIALGDFNGAGRLDVAVTNYVPGSHPGTVTALTNTGDWPRPPHRGPLPTPVPVQALGVGPSTTTPVPPAPALFTAPAGQAPAQTPTSQAAGREVAATLRSLTHSSWGTYGSPEVDRKAEKITGVMVSADRPTVSLAATGFRPGRIYERHLPNVESTDGDPVLHPDGYYTLNELP
jgi:hypothetical protein